MYTRSTRDINGKRMVFLCIKTLYFSNYYELKKLVLKEMPNVPYTEQPSYWKGIVTVKCRYFWLGMKKDITDCIIVYELSKSKH
jgi:hypothetical protein